MEHLNRPKSPKIKQLKGRGCYLCRTHLTTTRGSNPARPANSTKAKPHIACITRPCEKADSPHCLLWPLSSVAKSPPRTPALGKTYLRKREETTIYRHMFNAVGPNMPQNSFLILLLGHLVWAQQESALLC